MFHTLIRPISTGRLFSRGMLRKWSSMLLAPLHRCCKGVGGGGGCDECWKGEEVAGVLRADAVERAVCVERKDGAGCMRRGA